MAVDAVGTVLVDRFGARLVIEQDHQGALPPGDRRAVGRGPVRLRGRRTAPRPPARPRPGRRGR